MKRLSILIVLATFIASCSSSDKKEPAPEVKKEPVKAAPVKQEKKNLWGYTGMTGPSFWASLDKSYGLCKTGKSQSPINLVWKKPTTKGSLDFNYIQGKFGVVDNGHTIQVNFPEGNFANIRGHKYKLKHLHFHSASEHTLSGKQQEMEAHFVHVDPKGNLAVVAVFIKEGAENPIIGEILKNTPSQKNVEKIVENMVFNPAHILPKIKTHYHYSGSLTHPPCTEGVNWNVLNTSITMSKAQLTMFREKYAGNFRPVQPLNGRKVTNY